jgi:hypothetical protein
MGQGYFPVTSRKQATRDSGAFRFLTATGIQTLTRLLPSAGIIFRTRNACLCLRQAGRLMDMHKPGLVSPDGSRIGSLPADT